ncbi:hypothetical protein L6164_032791 [Bauhinia variegata]|uniref:Uncharacterized protein n=1 Tax=Bauhinia variegata TaxID=167791 RepID=A0ACB9KPX9_BAUVA|nr:hypothetical protein L6164_032791 [Bauhinia variegata]
MANQLCYNINVTSANEFWQSDTVFEFHLSYLGGQIALILFLNRLFYYVLKPLRQPHFVAEILVGFLLSRDLLGSHHLIEKVFPENGVLTEEAIANIGIAFYVFLTGIEVNPNAILQARKKATCIAIAGVIIPMVTGSAIFGLYQLSSKASAASSSQEDNTFKAYIIWALAISATGFSVLARVLADLKLLYTGLGRAALSAALITGLYNWFMFLILIPFVMNGSSGIYSVLSTLAFLVVCFCVIRPLLVRFIDRQTEQESIEPQHLMCVVAGLILCTHITDTLGSHYVVGAFVFGLIIPHGKFADYIIDNLDYFGASILAPVFFVLCGMRIDFSNLKTQWFLSLVTILLLFTLKVFSTTVAALFFGMPTRNSMGLGLLMNTKGVLSVIILNIALDGKILSSSSYTLMMSAILLMTIVVSPIINYAYKPRKMFAQYKLRTVQKLRTNVELRLQACVHNTRQTMGMARIFEAFHSTKLSPLHVFALYLVEVTGHATSLVLAHMEDSSSHLRFQNQTESQAEFEKISNTFDAFAEETDATKVETHTAFSNYSTIHEDVLNLAEERQTCLILLPFHQHSTADGSLETTNVAHRDININILNDAPCSVGILVDRGLGTFSKGNMHILMVFIGGPDDQEALAVAWRMARHSGVKLSVVRILLFDEAAEVDTSDRAESHGLLSATMDNEQQKDLDDDYVSSFRLMAVNNNDSITYFEKYAHNSEDISAILTELDKNQYDLYIVGRGKGRNLLALSKLLEWSDYPELGAVGDILSSDTFGSRSSVLVLQQYGSGVGYGTSIQYADNMNLDKDDPDENLGVYTDNRDKV